MNALTALEYRSLLQSALPKAQDADTAPPDLRTLFTPGPHRLALDPDVTLVKGARGAGKTVWFRSLQDPELRGMAADAYRLPRLRRTIPLAGYGSELQPGRYPGPAAFEDLVSSGVETDLIWSTVLLTSLGVSELQNIEQWAGRTNWVRDHPDARDRALADADKKAEAEGELYLLLFDALERMHSDRRVVDRLVAGILKLALDLRTRTRNLRAKVFIRLDMLTDDVLAFPDASKLDANSANLEWSAHNLYGLLFHLLGNANDPAAESFRAITPDWGTNGGRFVPPSELSGDVARQREVFSWVAGLHMGTNHRKGLTYIWLPNHLKDGLGQVSPRTFLTALARANEITSTRFAGHNLALHWDGIRQGVQAASQVRVREITEDMPWVATAVSPLHGLQVPVERGSILERWAEHRLVDLLTRAASRSAAEIRTGPRYPDDYLGLIDELIQVGVISRRTDGRLDLPDVYRVAFGLGRKGGVPRVQH